jgi:hypothetical protein
MAKGKQSSKEEYLQIAILAGFFTAGGFLLVTLALVLYLTPNKDKDAKFLAANYEKLAKLLEDRDFQILRQTAENSERADSDRGLRDIISESMTAYSLEFSDFPAAANKKGVVTQKLTLQAAGMSSILKFVASVKDKKSSIDVLTFNLRPASRSQKDAGADAWLVTVEFRDQVGGAS